MKLYTYFRSGAAFRVRIALNLKGSPTSRCSCISPKGEQRAPEYARVNPQALVPALVLDDGTRLSQSLAIIEYLDEKYPQTPLLPKEPLAKARVRSLSCLIAWEIHPLNNLRVLQHLKRALGQTQEQIDTWYRHWIADGLAKLEAELELEQQILLRRHADDGRLLPGAANLRRQAVQQRSLALPDRDARVRAMHAPRRL